MPACIRAETGVGVSIVSGSHPWKGNWADFSTAASTRKERDGPDGTLRASSGGGGAEEIRIVEGSEGMPGGPKRGQQGDVADPAEKELLPGGQQGGGPVGIKGEQLVQREARARPREDEEGEVAGDHQQQHASRGHRKPFEEPSLVRIAAEVVPGETDHGHHEEGGQHQHHGGDGVEIRGDGYRPPRGHGGLQRMPDEHQGGRGEKGEQEGKKAHPKDRRPGGCGPCIAQPPREKQGGQERQGCEER